MSFSYCRNSISISTSRSVVSRWARSMFSSRAQGGEHDPADDVPDVNNARSPVTLLGDVWLLGPHRLACGNALSSESYSILMEGRRAQMVFTDPPYNVSIERVVSAHG